ncbi:MAG: hypothetical protein ACLQVD_13465 [Capsulimonadaceae bacterium]
MPFLRTRIVLAYLIVASLYLCVSPAAAAPQRHVLVIVVDYLDYHDLSALENTWAAADAFKPGLLSPGLPSGPDPVASVYATIGAGDSIRAGDISEGLLDRALVTAGKRVAVVGSEDGDDTGEYRPVMHMIPKPDVVRFGAVDGTVADPWAPGGRRVDPEALVDITQQSVSANDLTVVTFGDMGRLERENVRGLLSAWAYASQRREAVNDRLIPYIERLSRRLSEPPVSRPVRVFFVGAAPVAGWDHLTPFAVADFPRGMGGEVTSPTTRTPGLVAMRDIAPSILAALDVSAPIQMTGAPITKRMSEGFISLRRLDMLTTLNQRVQVPFFWGLASVGVGVVLFSVVWYLRRRTSGTGSGPVPGYGLRVLAAWPLALLLAPLAGAHDVGAYLLSIAVTAVVIGLMPSPEVILLTTAAVVVVDAFFGSPLVAGSVLSTYALSGIRFYGIGNEYMGVLIAGALMLPVVRPGIVQTRLLAGWFALVVFVLSFPAFGAKAGGAVTATATFLFAWWELGGVRVTARRWFGAVVAGFALVFVWAGMERAWKLAPSHIDGAVDALAAGRMGYIIGVALRKAQMALRILMHPGTLAGLAAMLGLAVVLPARLRGPVRDLSRNRPELVKIGVAGLRGCVVALLFNDSGVVAAILILMSLLLLVLHGIVSGKEMTR